MPGCDRAIDVFVPARGSVQGASRRLLHMQDDAGQGSVEAALVIPVLFILMLLLIQPGILLYDRMVMNAAAAEGCRLLATSGGSFGSSEGSCEAYIRHRLASIPPHPCFHIHDSGCTWDIDCSGNESAGQVRVSISNKVRPLPLFDAGAALLGLTDGDGNLTVRVEAHAPTQPGWVATAPAGSDPANWIGAWVE